MVQPIQDAVLDIGEIVFLVEGLGENVSRSVETTPLKDAADGFVVIGTAQWLAAMKIILNENLRNNCKPRLFAQFGLQSKDQHLEPETMNGRGLVELIQQILFQKSLAYFLGFLMRLLGKNISV